MNNRFLDWSDDRKFRAGYDAGYTNGHKDGYEAAKAESFAPVWTPCREFEPDDGEYDITIKSEFGKFYVENSVRFESGEWLTESDTGMVVAWKPKTAPYQGEARHG